jgi:large subunit ribosomal protein L9
MKIILLKNVQKVGRADQVLEVPDGYAQNALFPKKLAIPATPAALEALKNKQANHATSLAARREALDTLVQSIGLFVYKVKVNDKGSLFSRVTALDISKALAEKGVSIDQHRMTVPDGAIKHVGTYEVAVKEGEYTGSFKVSVEAQ